MEVADDILDEVDVSETSSSDPVVSGFDTAQQDQQDLVANATEVGLNLPADISTTVFLNDSQATNNVEISGNHEETASFAALELSPEQVAGYHLDNHTPESGNNIDTEESPPLPALENDSQELPIEPGAIWEPREQEFL